MQDVVERVKQRLYPSFALLERHLELVCRNTGSGGGGVFFRREDMKKALGGDPLMENPHTDFGDCEYDWVANPDLGPDSKEFCAYMRASEEGKRRCEGCDRMATRRVAMRKRSYAYTCHAGLTDVMAPVVAQERCVGVICMGRLLREGVDPPDFGSVWERIRDIPGLDREKMEAAHARLTVMSEAAFGSLVAQMEQAAHTVAGLWDSIVSLVAQERQLARTQLYQARDFAETLLYGAPPPPEDVLERARALGLEGLPTAAVAFQIDPTDRRVLTLPVEGRWELFLRLLELLHDVPLRTAGAVAVSVAPGEAVLLLHLPETRNPRLRSLQLKEAADSAAAYLRARLGVPVLMGIGPDHGDADRLGDSFREARRALWLRRMPDHWQHREHEGGDKILGHLGEVLENVQHALAALDRDPAHAFEQALRVIATVGEGANDLRRVLFVRMIEGFLERWTHAGASPARAEQVRLRYAYDFPSLNTLEDMSLWVRSHLLTLLDGQAGLRDSPQELLLRRAGHLVRDELDAPPSRAVAATRLGITESALARLFQDRLGCTYRDYVLRARMAHAQRALLQPGKSISEVAHDVGYFYTSAFTRAFVKTCGVSPSEYRASPRSYPSIDLPGDTCRPAGA